MCSAEPLKLILGANAIKTVRVNRSALPLDLGVWGPGALESVPTLHRPVACLESVCIAIAQEHPVARDPFQERALGLPRFIGQDLSAHANRVALSIAKVAISQAAPLKGPIPVAFWVQLTVESDATRYAV